MTGSGSTGTRVSEAGEFSARSSLASPDVSRNFRKKWTPSQKGQELFTGWPQMMAVLALRLQSQEHPNHWDIQKCPHLLPSTVFAEIPRMKWN